MGWEDSYKDVRTLSGGDEFIGFRNVTGDLVGVLGAENGDLVLRATGDIDTPNKTLRLEGVQVIGASTDNGFMDYNDTSTSSTPITLVADTWTTIPNDGLGAFTNKTYKPNGNVTELMDTSTGAIDPTGLNLGDILLIRNDFAVTPSTNNASLQFRYQLGTGAGLYTLEKRLGRLDEGSGIPYRESISVDKIYMGDTNTRDNPITLQVKLSTSGTLVNAGTAISVVRYGGG